MNLKSPTINSMPEWKRQIIIELSDGVPQTLPILFRIDKSIRIADEVFKWLHKRKIKGLRLVEMFDTRFAFLQICNNIIRDIEQSNRFGMHISDLK